jgi:hypothetical protein
MMIMLPIVQQLVEIRSAPGWASRGLSGPDTIAQRKLEKTVVAGQKLIESLQLARPAEIAEFRPGRPSIGLEARLQDQETRHIPM